LLRGVSVTDPVAGGAVDSAPQRAPWRGLVVARGHGWDGAGLFGRVAASSCRVRHRSGQVLPDPACTPGAIDPAVTQATLGPTICRRGGYTSLVRPPSSLTEPAKLRSMAQYGLAGPAASYEFDHLVPLELGGASDVRNLRPELDIGGAGGFVRNAKDRLERVMHDAVCRRAVTLHSAQQQIARDWVGAAATYGMVVDDGYRTVTSPVTTGAP
jgi:hypothetical protein